MKIYTKTGDKGETGLWGGDRIAKDSVRIIAYGTVDECNTILGVVRTCDIAPALDKMMQWIQNKLFMVGSDLATPSDKKAVVRIGRREVGQLEKWIDRLEKSLPPLRNFILPGGCPASAFLHQARTVCRRAERGVVSLTREEPAAAGAAVFLNRLSDFLFVAARTANYQAGIADILWDSPRLKKNRKTE
jgi:cob(I)alamin adenosyltransferase